MTGSTSMPWEKDRPLAQEWTDRAYDMLVDGQIDARVIKRHDVLTLRLEGPCPRCEHQLAQVRVLTAVVDTTGVLGADSTTVEDGWVDISTQCDCTEAHKGRPDGEPVGCGIGFRLLVGRG